MTTRKQIKELAAPLLARHADLALVKDTIVIRPVNHLLHFILIERTGNADAFDPRWTTTILIQGMADIPIGEARRLYRVGSGKPWVWSDATMVQSFVEMIENEVLPQLRAVRTLQDYVDMVLSRVPDDPYSRWAPAILCSLALGDLGQVQTLLEQNPRLHGTDMGSHYVKMLNRLDRGLGTRLLERGKRLERADRLKLAEHLHDMEELSVKNLGLEKIWVRTEFPIESLDV